MTDWRNQFIKPKTMFDFHAWMGLIVGICMIVIGFSGAITVFKNEIEWLLTPEARATPNAEKASIDEIVTNLERRYPEHQLLSLYFQPGPSWAHTTYIPDPNGTWFRPLIDPQSGEVRKKQRPMQSVSFFLRHLYVRLYWIIKSISIGTVVFPITIVLVIVSHRAVRSVKHGKRRIWFATVGGILLGIWYCFLLSLLN